MLAMLWTVTISHDLIAAATSEKSTASEPRKLSEEKARALAVYAPRPPYPELARAQGITGSGVVRVSVDPSSGVVTAARMQLSTGHSFLDDVALAAFRKWRFKPGTVSQVRIPITFSMRFLYVRTLGDMSWLQNVTNWSLPYYPLQAVQKGLTGSGVAVMKIDAQTGSVTSAVMLKSTGQKILDNAALQAFRQWRFKPGTLTTLDIPIEFTRASPTGPRLKEAGL
jgi:TonB family protein